MGSGWFHLAELLPHVGVPPVFVSDPAVGYEVVREAEAPHADKAKDAHLEVSGHRPVDREAGRASGQ